VSFTENNTKVKFETKDSSQVGKTFTVKVYAKAGEPESISDPYTIIRKITTNIIAPLTDTKSASLDPLAFSTTFCEYREKTRCD
jgi:hypothetical protein